MAGGLLLNRNGGRQAFDQIHIGFVELPQKLPRIGREAFHIAALTLGVQGVKRQAGLARAGQPRHHHQLVARDVQINVLEVVRTRTADADVGVAHGMAQIAAGVLRQFWCQSVSHSGAVVAKVNQPS